MENDVYMQILLFAYKRKETGITTLELVTYLDERGINIRIRVWIADKIEVLSTKEFLDRKDYFSENKYSSVIHDVYLQKFLDENFYSTINVSMHHVHNNQSRFFLNSSAYFNLVDYLEYKHSILNSEAAKRESKKALLATTIFAGMSIIISVYYGERQLKNPISLTNEQTEALDSLNKRIFQIELQSTHLNKIAKSIEERVNQIGDTVISSIGKTQRIDAIKEQKTKGN